MKAELGAAIAGDAWLDLLHYVADAETTIEPVVLEAARYGLGSDDPAVRSASGRVLVASGDEKLTTQVREVLEDEPNALVAHTLRSALRGATA
jgi:HEAT repeat protein